MRSLQAGTTGALSPPARCLTSSLNLLPITTVPSPWWCRAAPKTFPARCTTCTRRTSSTEVMACFTPAMPKLRSPKRKPQGDHIGPQSRAGPPRGASWDHLPRPTSSHWGPADTNFMSGASANCAWGCPSPEDLGERRKPPAPVRSSSASGRAEMSNARRHTSEAGVRCQRVGVGPPPRKY